MKCNTMCVTTAGVGAGQIASDGVNNLAFFSTGLQLQDTLTPLPSNPDVPVNYNASKTFVIDAISTSLL